MPDDLDWGSIILESQAELLVGWRSKPGHIEAGAIELSVSVATELSGMCKTTLSRLANMQRRPYGDSLGLEIGEEYAALSPEELPPPKSGSTSSATDNEHELSELESIVATAGLPSLSIDELQHGHYLFYAVVAHEVGTDNRIGFVRQVDPHRVARQAFLTTVLGQEGLQRLVDPIFVFDESFDVVVSPSEIVIFRLEQFNRLFADLGPIMAAAVPNAQIVAGQLPAIDAGSTAVLAAVASTRASIARRLQRLARPGALPNVSTQQLRTAMEKHGLDPTTLINGTAIVFNEDGALIFLDMMEELYYETDFTHEHRRADRYSQI